MCFRCGRGDNVNDNGRCQSRLGIVHDVLDEAGLALMLMGLCLAAAFLVWGSDDNGGSDGGFWDGDCGDGGD